MADYNNTTTNLENGSDLWSQELPGGSSSPIPGDLSMDIDLSPAVDCYLCGSFFDEEQDLAQAEGAPHAIDDTSIDELARALEAEHFGMFHHFDQGTDYLLFPELIATEEMELTVCDVTEQNAAQAVAEDDPYEFRAEDNMPIYSEDNHSQRGESIDFVSLRHCSRATSPCVTHSA